MSNFWGAVQPTGFVEQPEKDDRFFISIVFNTLYSVRQT